MRYTGGVKGYLAVLTNETNALSGELRLVQAPLNALLAVVQLRVVAHLMVSVDGFRETSSLVGKHLVSIRLQLRGLQRNRRARNGNKTN
jgi:hypothetical protein